MPEGHTVHRVARLFDALFVGRTIEASSPQGRFSQGAASISGRTIVAVDAVGKQLFMDLDNDLIVRVHLGIYGAWDVTTHPDNAEAAQVLTSLGAPRSRARRFGDWEGDQDAPDVFPPPPVGQVRLRLVADDVVADLRGPTACEVITREQADAVRHRLGPDPLVMTGVRGQRVFSERLLATKRPIGLVLMDQSVVAGIGNVYRAEILFRHRLDPYRPASSHSPEVAGALWKDWGSLLRDGIATGVMLTRDGLSPSERKTALRSAQNRHWVYKREGKECRVCGSVVVMDVMAARKLYYCPSCQAS
ncbi:MAG: Fpg/Nei family DNA glycosylase [Actinobacteria bacterium]|uniref:DNA-(apurinic or apyrimidinic site) lyase n=1 Tax=freshwater metagenome TaxID=449393 RepID=A0A6J6JK90_9ZZZZ|nr:Fpg/Nei family DNA glycosylase [Actinomycetota bacterium]MTA33350.1 Fpg/Nei family DNA glycosylase [Actinomycetota bacterium]